MNIYFRPEDGAMTIYMMNEEQIHSSWDILIFMLAIHCVLYYFQLSLSWTLTLLLAAFGSCMQFMYYTYFSRFIMLLWIYPILASRFATRFVTILGKKRRAKRQQSLKKNRNRSFSRFDTNLVKRERTVTERWEKGALKRLSEKCQFGPRETESSSHVQPNAVLSCPTRSLSTSPMRRGPTRCGPTR
jgi:hypothetical protein